MIETIEAKIQRLKEQCKAVILVHNYQLPEVQDIADFLGDSLQLSQQAAKTDAETIVFCGVHFMAETAAILSPTKTVLLPDRLAGCPMADMITADQLRQLKQQHPSATVVCYVNSSAEVKAESDYCCTSSNAIAVVQSLKHAEEIIFVPDKYLGQYASLQTGRKMILWSGYCPTHVAITEDDIKAAKAEHPDAIVMAHPECTEPVRKLSDQILSTGQMINFAAKNPRKHFIVATEIGIIHTLSKQNPDAEFIAASGRAICPNMKRITLEKVVWSLEDLQSSGKMHCRYRVTVNHQIMTDGRKALDRMVKILPAR